MCWPCILRRVAACALPLLALELGMGLGRKGSIVPNQPRFVACFVARACLEAARCTLPRPFAHCR